MKTKIYTTALITLITLVSINLNASVINFEDEAYIDDIPFNTEEVYANVMMENIFQMEDEVYIDDIPFNTTKIAVAAQTKHVAPEYFEMEDETYIDDIPFNTSTIAANVNYEESTQIAFNFNEEEYIDDIPFNTVKIVFKNEKDVFSSQFMIAACVNLMF